MNVATGGAAGAEVSDAATWVTATGRVGHDSMLTYIRAAVMSSPLYGQSEAETTKQNYLLVTLVNSRCLPGRTPSG